MTLKRKAAPTTEEQPKLKALKVQANTDKNTESPSKKAKMSKVEVSEGISEEGEIEETEENDAEEESENESDTLDTMSDDEYDEMSLDGEDEKDALDEEDEEDEEDEDAMDVDDAVKKSKPKSGKSADSEVAVKEVPAHAAQRALAKERKLSRPNANVLQEAKRIWETLRLQKQSKADRQKQVDELFTLISGDIPNLVFGHSASRFVQAAVKYGSPDQRLAIAKELEGRYIELSKAKYGKFLAGKILEYGNAEVRNLVVKEFLGKVNKLITHNEAGAVLNDIYRDIATPSQRTEILQEIYGPEFRLFKA